MQKIVGNKNFHIRLEALNSKVTGSCNYLTFHSPNGKEEQLLIDCGLFRAREELEYNLKFPFDCSQILAVLQTHEHSDHSGRIPCLFANGFTGKVYGSEYCIKKIKKDAIKSYYSMRKSCTTELYTENDVAKMQDNCSVVYANVEYKITDNIFITPLENAHTKGALMYLIKFSYEDNVIRILFTGDYKKVNITKQSYFPMTEDEYHFPITIVTEATHGSKTEPKKIFRKEIEKAIIEGKSIIVVATGESRFETIANEIKAMKIAKNIPNELPIFIDFKKNFDLKDITLEVLPSNVTFVTNLEGRREAIYEKKQKIIITTNRGGRDYFLKEIISNNKYLIFYTNYVSRGCCADRIIRTPPGNKIFLFGKECVKNANAKKTSEYSDHDYLEGTLSLLRVFKDIRGIFLEHGEPSEKELLKREIQKEFPKANIIILEREKPFRIMENGIKRTK